MPTSAMQQGSLSSRAPLAAPAPLRHDAVRRPVTSIRIARCQAAGRAKDGATGASPVSISARASASAADAAPTSHVRNGTSGGTQAEAAVPAASASPPAAAARGPGIRARLKAQMQRLVQRLAPALTRGAQQRGQPHDPDLQRDGALAAPAMPAQPAEPAEPVGAPFTLVKRVALAGGQLDLVRLEGDRLLRIWMPAGYTKHEAATHPYPLLLLNDGQNLFDDSLSFSGSSWRAGEAAARLIESGQLPPFLVCGIDHAGANRSLEYLPYKPGTGPGGFRADAASWPGGEVDSYLDRVFNQVLPWVQSAYGAATDPSLIAFGGSSFGGICTLCACMSHGDRFGAALVESPSLWFADERFLREDLPAYSGPWPQRLFLAMGDKEYSGIRQEGEEAAREWDALLVRYCGDLAGLLRDKGLHPGRMEWEIGEGAAHTESAWAARLPGALRFLLAPWWRAAATAHADDLYFTSPRKLRAGQPATLFVQKARSEPLAGGQGPLHVRYGFNAWALGAGENALEPAPQLDAFTACELAADVAAGDEEAPAWQAFSFTVPDRAYEMQFVLTDGNGQFDNNAGADFYVRVKLPQGGVTGSLSPEAAVEAAAAAAQGPADDVAARSTSRLFFTTPEVLVAGAPARLFFNRARSAALHSNPNIQAVAGFNHFELPAQSQQLAPAQLWRGDGVDWWATQLLQVPEEAYDMTLYFTDGHGAYDSNEGLNFTVPVWQPKTPRLVPARTIASSQAIDHAGGKLHIINLSKRAGDGKAAKDARWTEEKVIRVWTPPGYSREAAPPGGWPVLWMCDGSNMFEDHLAHQGHAWNVGYCAEGLIRSGALPPFVVAAVDSAGPMRSLNYLPYKPGTGMGGFRGDAERWPGGGCEGYLRRLVQELMPLVNQEFGTATEPDRVAFGGGSFAGVTALYAAMHYPHVFGSVLAESPSLWIAEGRFLEDMWAYRGALPERMFIGCGTKEYSATRDHERPEIDDLLLHYYHEAYRALEHTGMRGPQRLRMLVEEGAGHHELAWAWRLSGALAFLLAPWREQ